jgi:hypothetical protein
VETEPAGAGTARHTGPSGRLLGHREAAGASRPTAPF